MNTLTGVYLMLIFEKNRNIGKIPIFLKNNLCKIISIQDIRAFDLKVYLVFVQWVVNAYMCIKDIIVGFKI